MSYTTQYIKQNTEGAVIRTGTPVAAYDGGVRFASAMDPTRFPVLGVVTFVRSDRRNLRVSQTGYVSRDDWTLITGAVELVPGQKYYLSTTAGMLTTTAVQPGAIENRHVGTAVTTETLQIALLGEDVTDNPVDPSELVTGTLILGSGVEGGQVTGLALDAPPSRVILTVRKPVDGLNIFASVIDGSLTDDTFDFSLSAQTDSGLYLLDYLVVP